VSEIKLRENEYANFSLLIAKYCLLFFLFHAFSNLLFEKIFGGQNLKIAESSVFIFSKLFDWHSLGENDFLLMSVR